MRAGEAAIAIDRHRDPVAQMRRPSPEGPRVDRADQGVDTAEPVLVPIE
jgi:hypothetical protein